MANRTAKFVSAIFVSILAGGHLATVSDTAAYAAAPAAENCLSGPKGKLPPGGHWYYRIDRATKRQCWYIGDEKEKATQAAPKNSSASASPASPPKTAITPPSIADARAELPMPQTRVEPEASVTAAPRTEAPVATIASMENSQRANVLGPNTQQSAFIFASRWPNASGASSSADPAPAADERAASQQPAPAATTAPPLPATAPTKFAAADDASTEKASGSIQMLLIVIVGALAVAGLMASAIFKFGGRRSARRRDIKADRRAIWDSVAADRSSPTPYPIPRAHLPGADVPRGPRPADSPNDRITEMLARLARTAHT